MKNELEQAKMLRIATRSAVRDDDDDDANKDDSNGSNDDERKEG